MKIKEAIEIINATDTVSAKADGDDLLMYQRDKIYLDWFLRFPTKANNWSAIAGDWYGLLGVYTQDLARVMDVVQRLLDTPVEERFPEKQKNCPYCHEKGGNHYVKPIEDVPGHSMGLILREDGWHLWTNEEDAFETIFPVKRCPECGRPLNEEEE